jgi:integrase
LACIVKRKRKDGTASYHVKYTAGDGKQRWEQFDRAKDAQSRKAAIETELAKNRRWAPPASVTFEDYAQGWLNNHATRAVKPRVLAEYKRHVRVVWLPALGKKHLGAVTRLDVKAVVASLHTDGKADSTIRNALVPFREMLGHAVEDGLIPSNPAAGLRIRGGRTRKIVPPTREEIAKLIDKARAESRDAIVVASVCGFRRGELFALRWADIDFQKRMIRVHASNYAGKVDEATKTDAGERFVPLFDSARKVLAARKLRSEYNRPEDFVFGTVVGTPADPGNFVRREFRPARDKAGLPGFRWHDLRHFAVSALIEQRADIKLLQAVAGHASAMMTLDVYGHLMNERVSEAAMLYDPLRQTASAVAVDGQ